jgi:programmed cell death protein 5
MKLRKISLLKKKMDELEALKKKKLEELKRQQGEALQKQAEEQAQLEQQIEQLESVVKQVFTKDALSRYGNIKAAHPERAVQLLVVLGQLIQKGKASQINDVQLKEILRKLDQEKKEFHIKRK